MSEQGTEPCVKGHVKKEEWREEMNTRERLGIHPVDKCEDCWWHDPFFPEYYTKDEDVYIYSRDTWCGKHSRVVHEDDTCKSYKFAEYEVNL